MKKFNYQLLYLLLPLLVGFVAFYGLKDVPLANFEDPLYITSNKFLKTVSGDNIAAVFTQPFGISYRPLTFFSYFFNYDGQGLFDAKQIHAVNLWLHLFNAGLVAWLIYLLTSQVGVSVLTALLFVAHPTKVEAVALGMARNETLGAFFLLTALISYLYYKQYHQHKWLLGILFGALAVALFSSLTPLVFPLAIWLLDKWKEEKTDNLVLGGSAFLCLAVGVLAGSVTGFTLEKYEFAPDYNIFERIVVGCYTIAFYAFQFLVPAFLAPMYAYPAELLWFHYVGLIVALLLVAALVVLWRKQPKMAIALAWFFVFILPVANFYPLGGKYFAADRQLYLPSLGLALLLVYGVAMWLDNAKKMQWLGTTLVVIVVGGAIYLTNNYLSKWQDHVELWNCSVNLDPNNYHAYALRSEAYCGKANRTHNDFEKIKNEYLRQGMFSAIKAIELQPKDVANYYQKLQVHKILFDYPGSDTLLTKIISMQKDNWYPRYERAEIRKKFNFDEGIKEFSIVIKEKPDFVPPYEQRGILYYAQKKYPEALADFEKLVQLAPNYDYAYLRRGSIYHALNRIDEALTDYNKALQLNQYNKETYYNRALLLMRMGNQQQACQDINMALQLGMQKIEVIAKEICGQ
ncbi:MAG: tetratricopeptide repeat protein [Thermoflexibacteraceae bacterium]